MAKDTCSSDYFLSGLRRVIELFLPNAVSPVSPFTVAGNKCSDHIIPRPAPSSPSSVAGLKSECEYTPETASKTETNHGVDKAVEKAFPGALKNYALTGKVEQALSNHSYGSNTLVAFSLCCDEVNRVLEEDFESLYGPHFSMGGLAGFPWGGATSFGAMAHHIPEGGSCLIVYGPHVGVDADGTVGKVNRRGRPNASGICCGSAADAAGFVKKVVMKQENEPSIPDDPLDAQQTFVRKSLIPHGERLEKAKNPLVELPLALFDCQDELMQKIVKRMSGEVADPGKIALLGGVQINTPAGTSDYFLPKTFLLMNNQGEVVEDLISLL